MNRPLLSLFSAATFTVAPFLQMSAPALAAEANLAPANDSEAIKPGEFKSFGVAAGLSTHRGAVAVMGKDGAPKFLVTLADSSGGCGLVLIDPETGKSDFFPYPFKTGEAQFSLLYSSKGRFYNQFGHHLCEFDPQTESFTFSTKTKDFMSMMMTEDDHGVIWMATYPKAHLMSFNPDTKEYTDYGPINHETWPQYPRSLAVDDAGWVYAGIAFTKGQIVAFNPATKERKLIAAEEDRMTGGFDIRAPFHKRVKDGTVWRAKDGKVYARLPNALDRPWFRLHAGNVERVEDVNGVEPKFEVAGYQFLVEGKFPDGREITDLNVPKKTYQLKGTDGSVKSVSFDYPSSGAYIASLGLGPDGRVYGSTGHPLQFFAFSPKTSEFTLAPDPEGGHINALTSMGNSVFGAIYTRGVLVQHNAEGAPKELQMKRLAQAGETVLRPFSLIGLANGKELVMVGSPGYGKTGGGMFLYNTETGKSEILEHTDIIQGQSTKAIVELPDGNLLGATSIEAGTGGQPTEKVAKIYVMKMPERKVIFSEALIPGTPQYRDLLVGENGLVYGLAGSNGNRPAADFYMGGDPTFFVFDPVKKEIVHLEELKRTYGPLTGGQAPRVMAKGPDGMIYVLFANCIAQIDPKTYAHKRVANSPVPINSGIAMADDTIFFSSKGTLWGYRISR